MEPSFLLGSPVSFLGSPKKVDALLPSEKMSTSVEGKGSEYLSPTRDLCGGNLEVFRTASLGELGLSIGNICSTTAQTILMQEVGVAGRLFFLISTWLLVPLSKCNPC